MIPVPAETTVTTQTVTAPDDPALPVQTVPTQDTDGTAAPPDSTVSAPAVTQSDSGTAQPAQTQSAAAVSSTVQTGTATAPQTGTTASQSGQMQTTTAKSSLILQPDITTTTTGMTTTTTAHTFVTTVTTTTTTLDHTQRTTVSSTVGTSAVTTQSYHSTESTAQHSSTLPTVPDISATIAALSDYTANLSDPALQLTGARIQLLDLSGNVLLDWVSDGKPVTVPLRFRENYRVHAVSAPDGRITPPDFIFGATDNYSIPVVFCKADQT